MISIKSILFLVVVAVLLIGAFVNPIFGIAAYMSHSVIGPEKLWYVKGLWGPGSRYALVFAVVTAVSVAINWGRLQPKIKGPMLRGQEWLVLLFLAMVWVLSVFSPETTQFYQAGAAADHPTVKLLKVVIFALMLTHVVTTAKSMSHLFWIVVISGFFLGMEAYYEPRRHYRQGRLDTVGGSDFRNANYLADYMVAILPIIGMQFMCTNWKGKILCLASGAFVFNTVVLTRSRGAVVGLLCGLAFALLLVAWLPAMRRHRWKVVLGVVVALAGGYYLSDPQFLQRSQKLTSERTRAVSSDEALRPPEQTAGRLMIWQATLSMTAHNPLGVGPGNFKERIGHYNPEAWGRDAHSVYFRCMGDLGIPGLLLLLVLIGNAMRTLFKAMKKARQLPKALSQNMIYMGYGLAVGLVAYLGGGLTSSLLYVEAFWWFLIYPVCYDRAVDYELAACAATAATEEKTDLVKTSVLPSIRRAASM